MFPTEFPMMFTIDFPTYSGSVLRYRPASSRKHDFPSHPVNQMASHFPVLFASRCKKQEHFPIRSLVKTQNNPVCGGRNDPIPYLALPSVYIQSNSGIARSLRSAFCPFLGLVHTFLSMDGFRTNLIPRRRLSAARMTCRGYS